MSELELGNLNVIIKNADGTTGDHPLTIREEADVSELKHAIRETYPGNPKEERMKIVFSGRLLKDNEVLYDLVQTHDPSMAPVFHLLLRPEGSDKDAHIKMPLTEQHSQTPTPTPPSSAKATPPPSASRAAEPQTPTSTPTPVSRSESSTLLRDIPASPALAAASAAIERIAQQQRSLSDRSLTSETAAPASHDLAPLRLASTRSPNTADVLGSRTPTGAQQPHSPTPFPDTHAGPSPKPKRSTNHDSSPFSLAATPPRAPGSHGRFAQALHPTAPQAPSATSHTHTPVVDNNPQDPAAALRLPQVTRPSVGMFTGEATSPLGLGPTIGMGAVGFGGVGAGLFGVDPAVLQEQLRKVYYEAYFKAYLQHFTEANDMEEGAEVEDERETDDEVHEDWRSSHVDDDVDDADDDDDDDDEEEEEESEDDAEAKNDSVDEGPKGEQDAPDVNNDRVEGGLQHGQGAAAVNAPLLPGARLRVDDQARANNNNEDPGQVAGRTLQLALKLVFVVFLLGQDAPRERLYLICALALIIFLHQTGCFRPFSWLSLPRILMVDGLQYEDELDGDGEGGGEGAGGEGEGLVGLLSDVTALVVGFFTSLVPRTPAGVFAN